MALSCVTVAGLLLVGAAGASGQMIEGRDTLTERLRDGHIEVSEAGDRRAGGVTGARAVAIVDAPFGRVVRALADFRSYTRIIPQLRASRVLSQRGLDTRVFVEAALPHVDARWAELSVNVDARQDGVHVIEATMRRGNVNALFARWEVAPTVGRVRTLVAFELLVDPAIPLPDSMVTAANKDAVRDAINSVRHYMRNAR